MAQAHTPAPSRPAIQGLYELGHVLYALDAGLHGFSRGAIERVEYFWTFGDLHHSTAGFVLALRDGRRAYIDFLHWHAFEQEEDFRISVEFLPDGQRYPEFASPHEPLGDWSSETAHLDRALAG